MANLESSIYEQVDKNIKKCGELYQRGNYIEAIDLLEKTWELFPYPKTVYDESYHVVKYTIQFCLLAKDYQKAKKWANVLFICDLERADAGEREFFGGMVAFEMGELDLAKEFFYVANNKSEGRCFDKKDTKYLKFFKS